MWGPGFHGNPYTIVRAGEALESHLVQSLWGLQEEPLASASTWQDACGASSRGSLLEPD